VNKLVVKSVRSACRFFLPRGFVKTRAVFGPFNISCTKGCIELAPNRTPSAHWPRIRVVSTFPAIPAVTAKYLFPCASSRVDVCCLPFESFQDTSTPFTKSERKVFRRSGVH